MSDQYRRNEDDLAYGQEYGSDRGYSDQQSGQQGQDRGIIGDTFKKFKTKYDQYQGQRPQQDYGYGSNPSTSTVGSQQYGGSGYAGGPYNQPYNQPQSQSQNQPQQPGQPVYPGGPPTQKPQTKPDFADKLVGGLIGSVTSIGHDVQGIIGRSHGQRPSQNYGQQQGYQQAQSHSQSGQAKNRYESTFAGPKPGNDVKWYVDGCSYMWAVSQALENARQTIWILDWWLSPELYLRRPPARNEEWRIDKVLLRAANRGVKVNIIVYKEVTQALTLSSSHTKHALENLSPNIGVFRHPDHLPDAQTAQSSIWSSFQGLKLDAAGASKLGSEALKGIYGITDGVILYWAHHEKLCLIDGNVAFMGGLDLCYGRWDTNQHPISDAHPSDLNKIVFAGQDFNNARVMDFSDVSQPFQNKLDRTKSSRMGWSDISISLRGPCVGDLIHHFVDRWNFIYDEKYNVRKDKRYQRLPDYPDHRPQEGAGPAPPSNNAQTQPPQSTQFPPPPQSTGYVPPPWQGSNQSTNPSSTSVPPGASSSQSYHPQSNYGDQQAYPPPPPPPPPFSADQYGSGSQYASHPPPPSAYSTNAQDQYSSTQQQVDYSSVTNAPPAYHATSQQHQPYPPPPQHQGQYDTSQQTANYPQTSVTPGPGQYSSEPQASYDQTSPNTQVGHNQYGSNTSVPAFAPPPQNFSGQNQYSSQPQQDFSQHPSTFAGPPESQVANQQYAAYAAPQAASYHDQPTPQGPAELGSSQAGQYQSYSGQPSTRGIGSMDTYDSGHTGERGFGDDQYDYDRGDDRAFGRKPGTSPSRFDRYRDEAKRFKDEGRNLGRYAENKLDNKMAEHSGGRFGRPQSRNGGMSCQLVRSCTKWSNGTATEHSVQNAYIDLIQNAKYFIYIENQFFITATGDHQKPVKNLIGKALVERVIRAAREQQPFKIIVNIPSVPAFAGDLENDGSLGTRAIMEFQYSSICRGNGNSIMEQIAKAGVNPMDYIRFYNLRNYDRINVTPAMQQAQQQAGVGYDDARKQFESHLGSGYGTYGEIAAPAGTPDQSGVQPYGSQQGQYQYQPQPQQGYGYQQTQNYNQYQHAAQGAPHVKADDWDSVSSCYMLGGQDIRNVPWSGPPESELDAFVSEELYIHSKVMIVDDQTVICGSANLNDRSMLGTHDSEIALVINDQTPVQSTMAGRPWQASRFASSLRRQLFRKHLGLLRPQDMQRPDDNFMPVGVPNNYDWGTPEDHIVSDPLSDAFQSLWNTRARTNTEVFRKAFRAVPDDNIKNWIEYKQFYEYYFAKADGQAVPRVEYGHVVRADFPGGVRELKELLSQVKGTLVEMPLCFLQDVDIAKEGLSFNSLTAEVYT